MGPERCSTWRKQTESRFYALMEGISAIILVRKKKSLNSTFKMYLFYVYVLNIYMYVQAPHICLVYKEARRWHQASRAGITDGCAGW